MNNQQENYSLYYSKYCYFCQKVLSVLRRGDHNIVLLNTSVRENQVDLINGGGKPQVPCLKVDVQGKPAQWLYESDDIIKLIAERRLLTIS